MVGEAGSSSVKMGGDRKNGIFQEKRPFEDLKDNIKKLYHMCTDIGVKEKMAQQQSHTYNVHEKLIL